MATVHGVDTRGEWQKRLAPILSRNGFVPYLLDYGQFSKFDVVRGGRRKVEIRKLAEEFDRIRSIENVARISVIAHSFGTYLTTGALRLRRDLLLDNALFVGSVVDPNFNWGSLFRAEVDPQTNRLRGQQLNSLRNEVGGKDVFGFLRWLRRLRLQGLMPDGGPACVEGFVHPDNPSHRVFNAPFELYEHSDAFTGGHADNQWIPFLHSINLHDSDRRTILEKLQVARRWVGHLFEVPEDKLRASYLILDREARDFYIPSALAHPVEAFQSGEIEIRHPLLGGSVGRSFRDSAVGIADFRSMSSGDLPLSDAVLAHLHPDLAWTISIPVRDLDDSIHLRNDGVVNIDCLGIQRTRDDLRSIVDSKLEVLKRQGLEVATAWQAILGGGRNWSHG